MIRLLSEPLHQPPVTLIILLNRDGVICLFLESSPKVAHKHPEVSILVMITEHLGDELHRSDT